MSSMAHAAVGGLAMVLVLSGPVAADIIKGPWLQNVKTNSITVVWEADSNESATPTVEYGTTSSCGSSANATRTLVDGQYHVYTAVLSSLSGATIYHYRVNSGATTTPDRTFRAAPAKGTTGFRFYALGDNRSNPSVWGSICSAVRADMSEYPPHHQTFVLNSGDIVADGRNYGEYQTQLFAPGSEMLAELPMYVGFGNHEDRNSSTSDALLYGYFDFPYTDSGSTDEKWYALEYGNVHVAAMAIYDNAGYTSGPQYNWIQADLAAADSDSQVDWTFVLMHFPPWSIGNHGESERPDLRTVLHPMFSAENVICGFGGHNHLYGRYLPVDGVTYITTGGAGAGLHTGTYTSWSGATLAYYEGVHHYCVVDVEDYGVCVRAIDLSDNRIDYVTFGGTGGNAPPIADAGAGQQVNAGPPVTLDGSGSEDPESAGLTYEWTQVDGPSATLSSSSAQKPTFTPTADGEYVFKLRVRDGTYWSTPDFVRVSCGNRVTFSAQADTYVTDASPGTNYGSATTMSWDNSPNTEITFVRFQVSGSPGSVTKATLRFYCADPGDPGDVRTCTTTWAENQPTYSNQPSYGGSTIASFPASAAGAWQEADVTSAVTGDGAYGFAILPTGGGGADFHTKENASGNDPELVVSYGSTANQPPTVSISSPANGADFLAGQSISFSCSANDPDGDSLTIAWSSDNDGALGSTASFLRNDLSVGAHAITVTVDDGSLNASASVTIEVLADTDGDGLPDVWELTYFGTVAECVPGEDPDEDGLTNLQEYESGTHPLKSAGSFSSTSCHVAPTTARSGSARCSPTRWLGRDGRGILVALVAAALAVFLRPGRVRDVAQPLSGPTRQD